VNVKGKAISRPARSAQELPAFDPAPSARAGVEILERAGVGYALIGRVAVWLYLPPEQHTYTKDVDFAVFHADLGRIAKASAEKGYRPKPLSIGGFAIRGRRVTVDFVDRHPELSKLFAGAIRAARRSGPRFSLGKLKVPVVPKKYLIAMKIATMEDKDERDAASLIMTISPEGYRALRSFVRRQLGPLLALRLDAIARRAGHAGAVRAKYR
jgi:hypothetical protein